MEKLLREIKELKVKLEAYEASPYKDTYLSILKQLQHWSKQLDAEPVDLTTSEDDDDEKAFQKVHLYILNVSKYFEQLQWVKGKLSPSELTDVKKQATSEVDEIRMEITGKR